MNAFDSQRFKQLLHLQKELGIETADTLQGSMLKRMLEFMGTPAGCKWKETKEAKEILDQ